MVTPAEQGLETAPGPDEGKVVDVDFERDKYLVSAPKACQHCGEPVDRSGEHIRAHAIVYTSVGTGSQHRHPVFCDRDCWLAWATR